MSQGISELLKKLKKSFPKGYVNYNEEFVAHRLANRQHGGVYCSLRNCDTERDLICTVIESLSCDCCKTRPFNSSDANILFRSYMIDGMNMFLGKSFSEVDFNVICTHLGYGINHKLTVEFLNAGYDIELLKRQKFDRMISEDKLLQALNGVEYRARTLEQIRGGNDVLRRLLPKLINQQPTVHIVSVVHCEMCQKWQRNNESSEHGWCEEYNCTKSRKGYCDSGKEKQKDN